MCRVPNSAAAIKAVMRSLPRPLPLLLLRLKFGRGAERRLLTPDEKAPASRWWSVADNTASRALSIIRILGTRQCRQVLPAVTMDANTVRRMLFEETEQPFLFLRLFILAH